MDLLGIHNRLNNHIYDYEIKNKQNLDDRIDANTSNISNLQTDTANNITNTTSNTNSINTINNKFPQYYKTLIYRQKVDGNNLFTTFDDTKEFNNTISTPLSSNKFSIINNIEDIRGNTNTYIFMLKVIPNNANITLSSGAIDLKEDNKNIIVISQEFNPIYSCYNYRSVVCNIIASHGLFRNTSLFGSLKISNSDPNIYGFDMQLGATYSNQNINGIGQRLSGTDYDCFRHYATNSSYGECWIKYNDATLELYQISKNNYQRPVIDGGAAETITTSLDGINLFDLNYLD